MLANLKTRVFYRLLLIAIPFTFFSILLTGSVLSWTSYSYFLKTIEQDYRNIIRSSAGEIRLYMENARRGLESLAWVISATKLDRWSEGVALTAFNHTVPAFIAITLVSKDGEEIATAGLREKGTVLRQNQTFRTALEGRSAISGVRVTPENIPYVFVAVPMSRHGETEGVLWGELNLKSVWDVLEGVQIGDTGEIYIADFAGRLIGHRAIDRVVNAESAVEFDALEKLKRSEEDLVEWTENRNGKAWYCLGYVIPDLNWIIVLSQQDREIFAHLYGNFERAALLTGLICLATILLAWGTVKRFLAPVRDLHAQVRKIGRGELDEKVKVNSQDEIGDLAVAFNEMTDSLKQFIAREIEAAKELVHARNLATLGAASSKVTHEVGNLLNNIMMALVILKTEALSPAGNKALEILDGAAGRVETFVRNFLQFAKKPELSLQRVSLEKILEQVVFVHGPRALGRDVRFEVEWPSDLPTVGVDLRLMSQVMDNLLKNALDALTGPGRITVSGEKIGDFLQIVVKDSGPGIESELLDHIFEPFFTTKGRKGTGLGLAICKTIVEAHRGTIECLSEPGKGAAFIVRLPLR